MAVKVFITMFDSLFQLQHQQQEAHCPDTMCAFLPLGFVLMSFDIYHDLQWCLVPSHKTSEALRRYYTVLLTPRLTYVPWPGYLFPIYATFVFLWQCPNIYNWYTLLLYLPLTWRYYLILTCQDKKLCYWWTVIGIRIALTFVTIINLQRRNCGSWPSHIGSVLGLLPNDGETEF